MSLWITRRELFRIRAEHVRTPRSKKGDPHYVDPYPHRPNDGFYMHLDGWTHQVLDDEPDAGGRLLTLRLTMRSIVVGEFEAAAHVSAPGSVVLVEERDDRSRLDAAAALVGMHDADIIDDQALWPRWPVLDLHAPEQHARGGVPFGHLYANDNPRGARWVVNRIGDDDQRFGSTAELVEAGWRVRT